MCRIQFLGRSHELTLIFGCPYLPPFHPQIQGVLQVCVQPQPASYGHWYCPRD